MGSIIDFVSSKADRFDTKDIDLFIRLIITDTDKNQLKKKKTYYTSKSDAQKQTHLPNKIFHYLHVTCCKKLFVLT